MIQIKKKEKEDWTKIFKGILFLFFEVVENWNEVT